MFNALNRPSLSYLLCSALFLQQSCHAVDLFSFSDTWQVLGPFQIGTREATWGADPLEYYGGFRNLKYDAEATFRSALPANGTASWNVTKALQTHSGDTAANASLSVTYSNVDWDFMRLIYGWAAVQYQAWARGELIVEGNKTQHVILHTDAILEYWVDDEHYFGGDYYRFRKAPPVLHLKPGSHTIDLRLARDVRAFGGILYPTIDVVVDVQQASGTLELAKPGILLSNVVQGKLASPIGSVYLRNSGEEDIDIISIAPTGVGSPISFGGMDSNAQILVGRATDRIDQDNSTPLDGYYNLGITIFAGQTRPVAFNVTLSTKIASSVEYTVTYKTVNSVGHSTLQVSQSLTHVNIHNSHKITFPHPGGMVSYAMLRPPPSNATCLAKSTKLPVLLQLHGAGLEADNPMVAGALDSVSNLCAWVLFPTGVTPWSGDDWHTWGFADVEAAIHAIPGWIEHVGWSGPGVDTGRWIVSGHSNGGQGTWYALTHRPDHVLAAAPVSGYTSIQNYVPYHLWQSADPRRTAVISASLNNYRHEMLMPNAHGIPIQQQHGEIDDNVPAYHSRLLAEQLYRNHADSSYNEVAGKNHWWDTVMTTSELVDFYYKQMVSEDALPRKMEHFLIVVGDPGDMGSKNGIKVKHLEDPGRYGRVGVRGHVIKTSNVQDIEFETDVWKLSVNIDGQELDLAGAVSAESTVSAYKTTSGWKIGSSETSVQPQRSGRQLGTMSAVLQTKGHFIIRHPGLDTSHIALQISRNLHQYFQADTSILSSPSYFLPSETTGNIITLAIGSIPKGLYPNFPIRASESGVAISDYRGHEYQYGQEAKAAAFLRPLEGERLELVLWGVDKEGLRQASRMVPMLTGVGQPDFVVLGENAKWKGVEGALAMGFFGSDWKVTPSSVVESG
ncbi:Peptidase-S9 domain containing protein [Pyrenophora tritici-repentis]|uniref:Peptidase-S9 domain containing protein n=1 Tax=Pyrenophora tritici-repentis TaxID=45151 RepID=A0A922NKM6_9PLEO|nr:Peptidase-S9 domain containing protein [Pyrenophora tritici-repentis]